MISKAWVGLTAKCDVAIPNNERPRIVIESKAYGATGSKMDDVIGDIQKIIEVKRDDTSFLLLTDGSPTAMCAGRLRKE